MADQDSSDPKTTRFHNEVERDEKKNSTHSETQESVKKDTPPSLPLDGEKKKKETLSAKEMVAQTVVPETLTKRQKMLSAFGYIFFLCVLPLALEPNSKFCKFHGKQSMVMLIVFQILFLINIFSMLWVGRVLYWIFYVTNILLIIIGFMQAVNGKKWKIPFIGDMAEKIEI